MESIGHGLTSPSLFTCMGIIRLGSPFDNVASAVSISACAVLGSPCVVVVSFRDSLPEEDSVGSTTEEETAVKGTGIFSCLQVSFNLASACHWALASTTASCMLPGIDGHISLTICLTS